MIQGLTTNKTKSPDLNFILLEKVTSGAGEMAQLVSICLGDVRTSV